MEEEDVNGKDGENHMIRTQVLMYSKNEPKPLKRQHLAQILI